MAIGRTMTNLDHVFACQRCGERIRVGNRGFISAAVFTALFAVFIFMLEETRHRIVAGIALVPLAFLVIWLFANIRRRRA